MGAFEIISLILALAGLGSSIGSSAAKASKQKKYQKQVDEFNKKETEKVNEGIGDDLSQGSAVFGSLPSSKKTTTQNIGTEKNINGVDINTNSIPETGVDYNKPSTDLAYVAPSSLSRKLALKRQLGIS